MNEDTNKSNPRKSSMNLEGSRTLENLRTAYMGESQAFTKYRIFSGVAKKDGYEQIAELFATTAENEKEHAKLWLRYLEQIGSTHDNLVQAAGGEHYEWTEMYKGFAQTALEEGFEELAGKFMLIARIEEQHEAGYNTYIKQIEEGTVFSKPNKVVWVCRNCGFTVEGEIAPRICPVCSHLQSYFEVKK